MVNFDRHIKVFWIGHQIIVELILTKSNEMEENRFLGEN